MHIQAFIWQRSIERLDAEIVGWFDSEMNSN
jgi:hypothetical protein